MNSSGLGSALPIIYIVALIALFYFIAIRPQQQRQKKHQQMLNNIKVNDWVTTAGGMLGSVVKIKEDTVVLRVADNVRIEFLKNAIAQIRESAPENDND